MPEPAKLAVIYNPAAGNNSKKSVDVKLRNLLRQRNIPHSFYVTTRRGEATDLSRAAAEHHAIVAAVGGDGTVNEVASGLVHTQAALGIFPTGSGNDLNKMIGYSSNIEDALDRLITGRRAAIDVGRIRYKRRECCGTFEHFFANSVGIGIDAEVAFEKENIKYLRGLALYLAAALKVLTHYRPTQLTVGGDWHYSGKSFLVTIGNGKFEGGGFKLLPDASPDDGKLDVCIIPKMGLPAIVSTIPRIIAGTHMGHRGIIGRRFEHLTVASLTPFGIHTDGEVVGNDIVEVDVTILKGALKVILP